MTGQAHDVRQLGDGDVDDVVDVLWESFHDYPVMRFVLGSTPDYDGQLRTLIRFFANARVARGETLLGVGPAGAMTGVAMISRPERSSPPEMDALRDGVWAELGEAARRRYEHFGAALGAMLEGVPHIHLNMIGVRATAQGTGVGRALLDYVHRMSAEDPTSEGVSLTTEVKPNVGMYEHFGYEVIGHATFAPGLETWGMFRKD